MKNHKKPITILGLFILALIIIVTMFSFTPPEQTTPWARIEFYPGNGADRVSYLSYSDPAYGTGYMRFRDKGGNEIYLSGSFTVVYLK